MDTHTDEKLLMEYVEDRFAKFEEHEACWDIKQRGGVGETLLHMCILHDTPTQTEIAKILLSEYPRLSLDIFEEPEYYGEFMLYLVFKSNRLDYPG